MLKQDVLTHQIFYNYMILMLKYGKLRTSDP